MPEESGRLVTAFLERFFEKYVSYDYTAELEEELDDVSGGRLRWQKLLDDFWRDFKPKAGEVMDQKPSEITQALDEFLAPWLYPPRADGSDPRVCPQCGNGRLNRAHGQEAEEQAVEGAASRGEPLAGSASLGIGSLRGASL